MACADCCVCCAGRPVLSPLSCSHMLTENTAQESGMILVDGDAAFTFRSRRAAAAAALAGGTLGSVL